MSRYGVEAEVVLLQPVRLLILKSCAAEPRRENLGTGKAVNVGEGGAPKTVTPSRPRLRT